MVPAEPFPKARFSAATKQNYGRRNTKANTENVVASKSQGARKSSKLPLAPPLTNEARRTVTNTTEKLMRKRNDLDKALLSQASRLFGRIKPADWLPREYTLRQCESLARRERRHIRFRTKVLAKRTRLYKLDPSVERAIDIDLLGELLLKFKRHLGPHLVAAESPKKDGKNVTSASSCFVSSGDKARVKVESAPSSGKDEHTSTDPSSVKGSSEDQKTVKTNGLDGAFDDIISAKKRKADELNIPGKEKPKKVKKEQSAGDEQSSTSRSQPFKTNAPQTSEGVDDFIAAIKADADKSQQKTSKRDSDRKDKVDQKAKEATNAKTASDNGSLVPFYKIHAKAMMDPEFNDHVHERPPNKRRNNHNRRPVREYYVCGAIPVPNSPGLKQGRKNSKGKSLKGWS